MLDLLLKTEWCLLLVNRIVVVVVHEVLVRAEVVLLGLAELPRVGLLGVHEVLLDLVWLEGLRVVIFLAVFFLGVISIFLAHLLILLLLLIHIVYIVILVERMQYGRELSSLFLTFDQP